MCDKIFSVSEYVGDDGRRGLLVTIPWSYSLSDTLECGQCFRFEKIPSDSGACEYLVNMSGLFATVKELGRGRLVFYGIDEEELYTVAAPLFSIDTDYGKIKRDVIEHTDSEWLHRAAEFAAGIAILKQDPWETLFSFIISQNNNIPRIKRIIRELSGAYGVNLCLQKGYKSCPLSKISGTPCDEKCRECGFCYSFPSAEAVAANPEKMLPSHPGFRYKYLLDAAERVASGECDLTAIESQGECDVAIAELMKIHGVGLKVASCTALFGLGYLDAFPIDVWMKRAIDEYFGGELDHLSLGSYRGVAQQYIFHYIRNGTPEGNN